MIVRLAWRNVWRNKTRSLIVIIATTLGLAGALFIASLITGMIDRWVKKSIDTEFSDIQIHTEKFVIEEDQKFHFSKEDVKNDLQVYEDKIRSSSYRLKAEGLAMSAHNNFQVILMGIDPEEEKKVTTLHEYLKEGVYFRENKRIKQALISQKLAEELKVGLGSKIVINLSDIEGEIVGEAFKVIGLFRTGNGPYDERHVFVKNSEFRNLLKVEEGNFHELALRINDDLDPDSLSSKFSSVLGSDLKSQSWVELSPALKMQQGYMDTFNYILLTVVLIALIFGIINTMLMVVLERTREIGMLRSLGLNDQKVGLMILLETIYLCLTGAIFGNLITFALVQYYGRIGIHFNAWEEGFENLGFESVVFPYLEPGFYLIVTILVLFTALLASYFRLEKRFN